MLLRFGFAKLSASVSKPTLGFVFVTPPVWHEPHELLNSRLPRLTWSVVNVVLFPDASNTTVRVSSSNSIAEALLTVSDDYVKKSAIF